MAIRSELTLRLQNSPGALHRVCEILREERINIVALSVESAGGLRIIVNNPQRAVGALKVCNYVVQSQDVLFLELSHNPGSLEEATRLLTNADVNIAYIYTVSLDNRINAAVVIGVDNVVRAASLVGF